MGEPIEVIQNDLEGTRSALADKLSQLGDKISGTVETVGETVEAVTETVENVTETAGETVEAVKETFDFQGHVERHPWLVVGGAVLLGYVGGKLLGGPSRERSDREDEDRYSGRSWYHRDDAMMRQMATAAEHPGLQGSWTGGSRAEKPTPPSSASSSEGWFSGHWLSGLTQQMKPELDALKGLALGSLFGLARDAIANGLPDSLKSEVTNIFNDMTQRAGGKPIQGSVMGNPEEQPQPEGAEGEDEAQEDQPRQEAASGPQSKGQDGGKKRGKNHRFSHR